MLPFVLFNQPFEMLGFVPLPSLHGLVGKVMGMSKGKANPGQVMELLKKAAED